MALRSNDLRDRYTPSSAGGSNDRYTPPSATPANADRFLSSTAPSSDRDHHVRPALAAPAAPCAFHTLPGPCVLRSKQTDTAWLSCLVRAEQREYLPPRPVDPLPMRSSPMTVGPPSGGRLALPALASARGMLGLDRKRFDQECGGVVGGRVLDERKV
eukprot:1201794-Rhodomonas_salina.1